MRRIPRIVRIVMTGLLSIAVCATFSCSSKKEVAEKNNLSPEQAKQIQEMKKNALEARSIVVAKVNGSPISMADLVNYMNVVAPQYVTPGRQQTPDIREKVKNSALAFLIFRELASQEAAKEGINPKPEDVDNGLKKLKGQLGTEAAYRNFLEANGLTEADLRKAMEKEQRYEMIAGKEIRQRLGSVNVDDKTMKGIYTRDKAHFLLPERITASDLYFTGGKDDAQTRKNAEDVLAALRKNRNDTSKVAGNFTSKQIVVTKAGMPDLYASLSRLKAGEVSGVVVVHDGLHIFKVEKKDGARQMTFDEAKPLIHQNIMLEAAEKGRQEWNAELRKNAKIEIMDTKEAEKKLRSVY